jgi:drug/metabolite transporter (DMT)-like permease
MADARAKWECIVTDKFAWSAVAGTVLLTVYGQLVIKWRVAGANLVGLGLEAKATVLLRFLFDPWIVSALAAAFIASLCWMSAMTRLPISVAYPFTSASFVMVVLGGVIFLGESLTTEKIIGVILVGLGLVAISRS